MGKISSSYGIFKTSKAKISSKYAMESPQSVHFYDIVRSFLFYFVDLETPKGKNNERMIKKKYGQGFLSHK